MKKSKFKGASQYDAGRLRPRKHAATPITEIAFSPGLVMRQAAQRRRARQAAGSDASPERL